MSDLKHLSMIELDMLKMRIEAEQERRRAILDKTVEANHNIQDALKSIDEEEAIVLDVVTHGLLQTVTIKKDSVTCFRMDDE